MGLNAEQRRRYERHLSLHEIGESGQEKLLNSRVLVVGAGGLGSPAAFYLSAAGVGTIGLMDGDTVDLGNLQRQILHTTGAVGRQKVDSASERIGALDPAIRINRYPFRLTAGNAPEILSGYDFLIDATDNFESKFLIAHVCHQASLPYSHAGISRFFGQTMTVLPGKTACYRCVFHEEGIPSAAPPEGPLGAVPGLIGSLQAAEAVKCLLSIGNPLFNTLFTCDALTMTIRKIPVRRDPGCPLCGAP
jgi:molybdopterin/thiamine biosynthesis adenylyltransferase